MNNYNNSNKITWCLYGDKKSDNPEFKMGVSPFFKDYLGGFHIDKNKEDVVRDQVREPTFSKRYSQLLQRNFHSKKRIDSARVAYGYKFIRDMWDIDPQQINDTYGSLLEQQAEGDYSARLPQFESLEPSLDHYSADIWLKQSIHRDISRIADFMGGKKQTVMRQLMYIPIVYHSQGVFLNDKYSYWKERAEKAYSRFEEDLDTRFAELEKKTDS